jgi:hypothetical protein
MNADCVIVDANIAFKCLHAGRGKRLLTPALSSFEEERELNPRRS